MIRSRVVSDPPPPRVNRKPLTWDSDALKALAVGQAMATPFDDWHEAVRYSRRVLVWAKRHGFSVATRWNPENKEMWIWRTS